VDFISEHNVGIPRLASGMQPTATMEERLRLVMHPRNDEELISPLRVMASATCLSLWLLHPVPSADISDTDVSVAELDSDTSQSTSRKKAELGTRQNSASAFSMSEIGLPGAPTGFWNAKPERKWADFSLAMPGSRLIASAGSGMRIQSPGTPEIAFSHEDLSAIVNLPANRRVVIGDAAGRLRLWDLNDGVPVSLIGQHAAKVTSIAHHESIGLVAGDDGGSVMRWDLQSGQVLATWSSKMIHGVQNEAGLLDGISASGTAEPPAVQSVRFSKDGSIMAILTGRWSKFDREQKVFFVESRSLKTLGSIDLELGTAVVLASPEYGWVSIDWSGVMKSIETRATLTTLNKPRVSAIVLCSTTLDPKRDVLN
jgi:WD40 repeat protein